MAKPEARRIVDDFGRRLGELRRERAWTQLELAARWGVSIGYVQLVEHGRENLTLESLALLAGVTPSAPVGAVAIATVSRAPPTWAPA